jgi:hypothetical protein
VERAGRLVGGWNATGGCSHAAIWENISSNLTACEELIYRDPYFQRNRKQLIDSATDSVQIGGRQPGRKFHHEYSTKKKRRTTGLFARYITSFLTVTVTTGSALSLNQHLFVFEILRLHVLKFEYLGS